jgi:replication factor C large subunit
MKQKLINWVEKYRPQTLSKVVGHPTAIGELRTWAQSWVDGIPDNRAIIIYGRAGNGKTSTAYALANDMKWEIVELNASDQRTAKIIEKIAGAGSQIGTLSGMGRLIILDEADNIHGNADRGGEKAIIGLIKKTDYPIILIANELYDMSYGLRRLCKLVQFKSIRQISIISILNNIASAEGLKCEVGVIEKLAENSDGDLRGAINDLQAIGQGRPFVKLEDIVTSERDAKDKIFDVLGKIFKGKNAMEAHRATFNLEENPEDLIQWIDENIPYEYTDIRDLIEAFSYLSRASLFLGRVRIRQNYRMWKYASVLMTAGIVSARSKFYMGYRKSQTPTIRKRLAETKGMRKVRDSLSKKIGERCHTSIRFTRFHLLPFFKVMIKNKRYAPNIAASLELNPEEIAFILDAKSETKEVQKIYEDAQLLINGETNHEIELYGKFREGETLAHVKEEKKEKDVIDKDKDTNTKDTNTKDTNIKDTNTKEKVQLSLADY